ncbi:unnamed protein product [Rotaria magnacalcarata]
MNGNQQLKMVNNEQIKSAVIELLSVSTTCYDDPTKDHSEPAASTTAPNNQMNVKKILLKLCDELRPNLILTTGGTGSSPDYITPEALYRNIDDDDQMSEFVLLTTVGLQTTHVYEKLCVVVLSTDSGNIHDDHNKIMLMRALKYLILQHTIYFQFGITYNT